MKIKKLVLTRKIKAPVQQIWQLMATPGHLEHCHPFCIRNIPIKWQKENSLDAVYYPNGKILYRKFFEWKEDEGYTVNVINAKKDITAVVSFKVFPTDKKSQSLMEITVEPKFIGIMPPIIHQLVWEMLTKHLTAYYFNCILKGYEYHITTGKNVHLNQFGWHPLYS